MTPVVPIAPQTAAEAAAANKAATVAPAVPLQITVAPTQPSHWLVILQVMSAVLNAETPLLLQVVPPKAGAGVVAGDIGLSAILAAYQATLPAA
jgi:hypothetical protein